MIVADTNLIAALVCQTDHTETALAVWEKDPDWLAPEIWQSEFRNVLAMMLRAKIIGRETALEAFRLANQFVETIPAGTGTILVEVAVTGAGGFGGQCADKHGPEFVQIGLLVRSERTFVQKVIGGELSMPIGLIRVGFKS